MTSFNLTLQSWIPVETFDGRFIELSTRDTLAQAHELRAIADSSPLIVAALTRHLLAVLHRAYDGPRSMPHWAEIASAGSFDSQKVNAYLHSVSDRMDLFHPTHPFAQTRGLAEQFAQYVTPIDELEVERSRWGGGRSLFRHRPDYPTPQMPPAKAARALLAHHAFATGGLVKKPGEPTSATAAPLARAALVLVRGETLFQTLLANFLKYGIDEPIPGGGAKDACAWEQPTPPAQLRRPDEPKRGPLGYLDLLTWLSRRVELVHDGPIVTGFINAVGQGLSEEAPRDPMVCYRRHEKLGWLPVGIDVERAFWRDASALFETARTDTSKFDRPGAIDLVADRAATMVLGDVMYDVEVLGIAAEKSRVDAVRSERVRARGRCFNDPDAGSAVRDALKFSEDGVNALMASLDSYAREALSPGDRSPDPAAVRSLVDSFGAKAAAWSGIGVAFDHFLRQLGEDPDAALGAFRARALAVVETIFRKVTTQADETGRWLKARVLAEKTFRTHLPKQESAAASLPAEGERTQ